MDDEIGLKLDLISQKLDQLIVITKLAQWSAIAKTQTEVRSDKINAAILDASTGWVRAGKMQAAVAKKTKSSTRTVRERIADLVAMDALEKRGGGPTMEYKACGLI
ncbi:MAG TPA: hypothetical protein VFA37_03750 [Gaiellaceae bacterium]|nr:hypothetical protein [Gaiellaceae bacterium]